MSALGNRALVTFPVTFKLPTLAVPAVLKLPPAILPVATINPPVPKLPTFALPDTLKLVSVPTLVILPCAASFTVFATPDVATFKFATRVVLVTVNGAVPIAMFEISRVAVILPPTFK